MNELFRKIYDEVISREPDALEARKRIEMKVQTLVEPYQDRLTDSEMETLKDLMYSIAPVAEQEGVQLGIQFAFKILLELLSFKS